MSFHIAIVGAGHAGVEAAFTLAKCGYSVDLWSNEAVLPYFRPRLIAVAFGQAEMEAIAIKPQAMYATAGIQLCHEPVTEVSVAAKTVNGKVYDGLLLTQGAKPFVPPFKGDLSALQTLWTREDALAIRQQIAPGKRLTVIGGGVLGIEAALRAAKAGLSVTLIEGAPSLMNGLLGTEGAAALTYALKQKAIVVSCGCAIERVERMSVTLCDGTTIAHDLLLCATGARPNLQLTQGLPAQVGLSTDEYLQVTPFVFAAGDVAQPLGSVTTCAVGRAQRMAQCAAKNLCSALQQEALTPWCAPRLPIAMKVDDVEFHLIGNVSPTASNREVRMDDGTREGICQTLLYRDDICVGIRSIGTRENVTQWEKTLQ